MDKFASIKKSDRVALLGEISVDYIVTLLKLLNLGAVVCPLNTRLPKDAIKQQLDFIHTKILFSSFEPSTQSSIQIPNDLAHRKNLDEPATILFTSGSTNTPKAVIHSLNNHLNSAKSSNEHIPFSKDDRWLLSLPLYHVSGLSILFRAMVGGGSVVISQENKTIAESVAKHTITHLSLVPTQLYRLLNNKNNIAKLRTLKAILLGGSAIPEALINKAIHYGLPIFTTYGLTETASQVATTHQLTPNDPINAGYILKNQKVKIAPNNEILVKGGVLFKEYITAKGREKPFDKEGWFPTGDLGYFDKEERLIVTGRKDNMFISGGENIQPEEIEKYLLQIDTIEAAIVVAVKDNDFGFKPVAFIKKSTSSKLTSEEIQSALKKHLPKFKIPKTFYPWPKEEGAGEIKINRIYFEKLAQSL